MHQLNDMPMVPFMVASYVLYGSIEPLRICHRHKSVINSMP